MSTDTFADVSTRWIENILTVLSEATAEEWAEGMGWYQAAHTFAVGLGRRYNLSVEQAAGIIAALSPRLPWDRNMVYADRLCATGDAPVMHGNKAKALRILYGAAPMDVLSGPKVCAFYVNILQPDCLHTVTVDRHACDVATGDKGDDASRQRILERKGGYLAVVNAYRRAAALVNITPSQAQAITWVCWRNNI